MRQLLMLLLLVSPLVGCTAKTLDLKEPVAGTYEVIGPAEGKFGGILLFNFIPIAYNQRVWKAHDLALENSGGDALIDITIDEYWYWAGLFNGNVTTVRGTAVKFKTGAGKAAKPEDDGDGKGPAPAAEDKAAPPPEPTPPPKSQGPKKPRRKN